MNAPLPVFVQQAAAAKCCGILARESNQLADMLIQVVYCMDLDFGTFTYPPLEVIFFMTMHPYPLIPS